MGSIDRIVASLVSSDHPLNRTALSRAAAEMQPDVAPLARPGDIDRAVDTLVGLGPLESLVADDTVSDVLVNAFDDVWVERSGALERTDVSFRSAEELIALVRRVITPLGLRIDAASPAVDARLGDGSRLHAIIPPAAVDGPVVAIRRFSPAVANLKMLVEHGALEQDGADLLGTAVERRDNILIAGATGAGKTTVLNALAASVGLIDRIVTVEDAAELNITGHVVRLESHPANVEGAGEVTMRSLLRHALRLRPDRIIVGEVRGPEALDMIQALSTGHAGSMSTIHANGPAEALDRLAMLASMAPERVPESALSRQIASAVDVVVFVGRHGSHRQIDSVHRLTPDGFDEEYRCS
ncbi:MAG: Flp pilus assembly complex ATPase component TadA [Actinomycetia bacterium]|nr:Flp pilus assembly complex ATPase component TadA [Actinomycetes bacterium]